MVRCPGEGGRFLLPGPAVSPRPVNRAGSRIRSQEPALPWGYLLAAEGKGRERWALPKQPWEKEWDLQRSEPRAWSAFPSLRRADLQPGPARSRRRSAAGWAVVHALSSLSTAPPPSAFTSGTWTSAGTTKACGVSSARRTTSWWWACPPPLTREYGHAPRGGARRRGCKIPAAPHEIAGLAGSPPAPATSQGSCPRLGPLAKETLVGPCLGRGENPLQPLRAEGSVLTQ